MVIILVLVNMARNATSFMCVGLVQPEGSWAKPTRHPPMSLPERIPSRGSSEGSVHNGLSQPSFGGNVYWSTQDFIEAHDLIRSSGKSNFQGCRIQVPTSIR